MHTSSVMTEARTSMNITAQQFPFLFFLCSLLLLMILTPIFIGSAHGATLLRILFTLVLISTVYVASNNRRNVTIAAILAVAWLVINWFGLERPGAQPGVAGGLLLIILNSYVFFIVLSRILQAGVHHVIYIYPGILLTSWVILIRGSRPCALLLICVIGLAVVASIDFPILYGRLGLESAVLRSLNLYALLCLFVLGLIVPDLCGGTKEGSVANN